MGKVVKTKLITPMGRYLGKVVKHMIFLDCEGNPYIDLTGEEVDVDMGGVASKPIAEDVETVYVPEVGDDFDDEHFIPVPRGLQRKN